MEIVEDTLDTELEEFLARPLFCHLGTASEEGPRVSPLWFLWEDGTILTHTNHNVITRVPDRNT